MKRGKPTRPILSGKIGRSGIPRFHELSKLIRHTEAVQAFWTKGSLLILLTPE